MLKLNLATGGRLELPAAAIIAVMKPADGINPSALMYDLGSGLQVDQLSDQFGFVKKLANDNGAFENAIEVTLIEPVNVLDEQGNPIMLPPVAPGQPAQPKTEPKAGKIIFSRSRIEARRDMAGPGDIRSRLHIRIGEGSIQIQAAETLNELDGVEASSVAEKAAA